MRRRWACTGVALRFPYTIIFRDSEPADLIRTQVANDARPVVLPLLQKRVEEGRVAKYGIHGVVRFARYTELVPDTRVIGQILPDGREVDERGESMRGDVCGRSDSREHEDLGRVDCSTSEDDLFGCLKGVPPRFVTRI